MPSWEQRWRAVIQVSINTIYKIQWTRRTEPGIPPLASPALAEVAPLVVVVEDLDMVVGVVMDLVAIELVEVDMDEAEVDPPAAPPEDVMLNC